MSLLALPDELLCIVGRYLSCYRDVRALVLCNRRLNCIFNDVLRTYSVQHCHGSLLLCAVQSEDVDLAGEILDQLALANKKRKARTSTQPAHRTADAPETDPGDYENELQDWDGAARQSIRQHPFYAEDYRIREILSVQRAFLAAIPTGSKALVACFLDRGASARFNFPRGNHPLPVSLAVRHGHDEVFDLLVAHAARTCGGNQCPIVEAVVGRRYHMVGVMVRLGVCVHWDEALSRAVGDRTMLDLMVDGGVVIEEYGHMALYAAIVQGDVELVQFLVARGADPHLVRSLPTDMLIDFEAKDYSFIYHAILRGHLEICKFLVGQGVRPEEEDLRLARDRGYEEIVNILSGFSYENVPEKQCLVRRSMNHH